MPNIFTDLDYAQPMSTYVSPPIAAIDETMGKVEDDYYRNQGNADKLEIAMTNLDVAPENAWMKQQALDGFNGIVAEANETGQWENATQQVRMAGKAFATDQGLTAAVKDQQSRKAQMSALDASVAAGDIPSSYRDFVKAEALRKKVQGEDGVIRKNGELYQDKNGTWKGNFSIETPPEWNNISKDTEEFLDGFKENEYFGQYRRTKDGWVVDSSTSVTSGGHEIGYQTKVVTTEEIYAAAKNHVMSNQKYQDQIQFELRMDGTTYEDAVQTDPDALKAIMNSLTSLGGYDRSDLVKLENEEIYNLYKKERIINEKIAGSVAKYDRTQTIGKNFGLTYERQMALKKAAAKAEKPAEEIELTESLQNYGITISNPYGHAKSIADTETASKVLKEQVDASQKSLESMAADLEKTKNELYGKGMSADAVENDPAVINKINDIERIKFTKQTAEFAIEANVKRIDQAAKDALTPAEYDSYKGVTGEDSILADAKQRHDTLVSQYNPLLTSIATRLNIPIKELTDIERDVFVGTTGASEAREKYRTSIREEYGFNKPEMMKDYDELIRKLKDNRATIKTETAKFTGLQSKVDNKLKETVGNISVTPAYVSIGKGNGNPKSEWADKSKFAHQVENDFRKNPNGYFIIDSEGRRKYDDRPNNERNADVIDVSVIGMSTENVGNHGYLTYAQIEIEDPDDPKKTIKENVYISPTAGYGSNIMSLARTELMQGNNTYTDPNTGKKTSGTELARKIEKTMIDKHMSKFSDHVIKPNESINKKVPIGYDGQYADITRVTGSSVEQMQYDVVIRNEDGSVNETAMKGRNESILDKRTYQNLNNIESDLETYTGVLFGEKYSNTRSAKHSNPLAFTTDVAKQAGLIRGVDYIEGDSFTGDDAKIYHTARMLQKNSLRDMVDVVDKVGLYTKGDNPVPRWSYVDITQTQWEALNQTEKLNYVKEMVKYERGVLSKLHK